LRAWFEEQFRPWALVNPDGSRQGLITGYYEPILKGSWQKSRGYSHPVFSPPEDMIVVELADLYPELKHLRLRGRLDGRKLVPYYSRAEWGPQESKRSPEALLWIDDPIDLFFMQIQGSGYLTFEDGRRVRAAYAADNGKAFVGIARPMSERGLLPRDGTSGEAIRAWLAGRRGPEARAVTALNPRYIFFRVEPDDGEPAGAAGVPLIQRRSIAIDPAAWRYGDLVFLDADAGNLRGARRGYRGLVTALDTGSAIRGPVRADFYMGRGDAAGEEAGTVRHPLHMWRLVPR